MKQTALRITTGAIIIAIGVGALLGALNVFPFWDHFRSWWPVLLIIAGLFVLIGDLRRNYIWGLVLMVIGGLVLMRTQDLVDVNIGQVIFPLVLIAIGLSIMINVKSRAKAQVGTKDSDDISVLFSGSETSNKSQNYKGGRVTTIFGGATLDLRDAKLTKEATLDVFALCGGLELRVPREWKVVSKVAPILGGVENKAEGSERHDGPVLILTGVAILGGVEVKT